MVRPTQQGGTLSQTRILYTNLRISRNREISNPRLYHIQFHMSCVGRRTRRSAPRVLSRGFACQTKPSIVVHLASASAEKETPPLTNISIHPLPRRPTTYIRCNLLTSPTSTNIQYGTPTFSQPSSKRPRAQKKIQTNKNNSHSRRRTRRFAESALWRYS